MVDNNHLGGHLNRTSIDEGSLDFLLDTFRIESMVDIGCGPGGMVDLAIKKGVKAIGIDGDTSLRPTWHENRTPIIEHDFRFPLEIKKYDLAWCVEFLEHVEEEYQENYLNVLKMSKFIFCSAAPPGHLGHHHVNCRPLEYWIEVFKKIGFRHCPDLVQILKSKSTMNKRLYKNNKKNFFVSHGMFFVREALYEL